MSFGSGRLLQHTITLKRSQVLGTSKLQLQQDVKDADDNILKIKCHIEPNEDYDTSLAEDAQGQQFYLYCGIDEDIKVGDEVNDGGDCIATVEGIANINFGSKNLQHKRCTIIKQEKHP